VLVVTKSLKFDIDLQTIGYKDKIWEKSIKGKAINLLLEESMHQSQVKVLKMR
jgi:hypothetical protein